jgi:Peptidase M15
MIRVEIRSAASRIGAAISALLFAMSSTGSASASENDWFLGVLNVSVSQASNAVSGTNERPARVTRKPRAVAFTKRPAETKVTDNEPKTNSLSGGITWQASSSCVPAQLRGVLADLVGNFGPVIVTSTCRGRTQNRAAGGADNSYHLSGEAVDFRVSGSIAAVQSFLAASSQVGGFKHYGGGLYHIDTGPRRSW